MKKKVIIFTLILLAVFSISSVCAGDVNDTAIASEVDSQIELTALEDNIESIDEKTEIGNFSSLEMKINNLETKYLELDKDYAYNETTDDSNYGIQIGGDNLVIDGKGHTLNGNGKSKIIFSYSNNITLKNIKFVNGINGAIIFHEKATCYNCTFINNTGYQGGAIVSSNHITLDNCKFINNNASYEGGAVRTVGGNIINSEFINNCANFFGGAVSVYSSNTITVENCTFTNNTVWDKLRTPSGGALHINGRVVNSKFINNSAPFSGGAIYGQVDVINSEFIQNDANEGGAIFMYNEATIINSKFTNNYASYNGGAISINWNGNIENCEFYENNANQGGAVRVGSYADIVNSQFTNNHAEYDGGAIYFSESGNIDESSFKDNTAKNGRAVYGYNNLEISSTVFKDKDTLTETDIISVAGTLTKSNVFIINSTPATFSSLSDEISACVDNIFNLTRDYIYTPSADEAGGYNEGIKINRDNFIIDGNGATIDGKGLARAFNITGNNVTLKNINFINGNASYGGAIFWNNGDNGNIINCLFENNEAYDGGAIYFKGKNGIINESDFKNNKAHYNGAVYMNSVQGTVINCIFINNIANDSAGALGWVRKENGTIVKSKFINNSAPRGGAIYLNNCNNFFIDESSFENNTASKDGGAIYWDSGNEGRIINSSFINNKANGHGGAIFSNDTDNGNITGCLFNNNKAYDGGAIYFEGHNAIIKESNFTNNAADNESGYSGAVFIDGNNLTIIQSEFINNSAHYEGAMNANGENITIVNSRFESNKAESGIVAIYADSSIIDECEFMNNCAEVYVGISNLGETMTINNSYFINNTAERSTRVIRNSMYATTIITNCVFENNTGNEGNYSIDNNYGTIHLYNNTINTNSSEIYNYGGNITSPCTAIALENKTITVAVGEKTTLTAIITDDNGNMIEEAYYVYFKINDELIESTYNPKTSRYEAEYTFSTVGSVQVGIACPSINLSVQNGTCIAYSTFADLVAELNKCQNNTFELTRDYIYEHAKDANYTEGIVIDKADFTIDGQGHTIDGSGLARIFYITADNVTLKNINFINGNASYGGAIYWESGSNSQIINCIFKNNVASKSGGANFFNAGLTNVLISGEFIDNVAESGSGGANFFMESVTNVTIIGDYSHNMANSNCNGSDKTGSGGANCFNKTMDNVIISGNYTDNMGYRGGANYFYSDGCNVSILGDYKNNTGLLFGGANYFMNSQTNINVIGDYINNKATNRGGANYFNKFTKDGIISGDYINNTAVEGSAIFLNRKMENVSIFGNLIDNQANSAVYLGYKVDSTLAVNDMVFDYGSTGVTEVSFAGAAGVTASVIYQPDAVVVVNNNTIMVYGLDVGTYILSVTTITDDEEHDPVTKTARITVNKLETEISASEVITVYNDDKYLVATLKDIDGKPMEGVDILIELDGLKYLTTDKNGQVKLSTMGLVPKTYTATILFAGNRNYASSAADVKVTVKKATPKLTAKKKTFKVKLKTKKYAVTLKDNMGKAINNVEVTLKIKGKAITAKTNKKGKVTFKIKTLKKKGKYSATVTFKGNSYYNKATKKVKITVKK